LLAFVAEFDRASARHGVGHRPGRFLRFGLGFSLIDPGKKTLPWSSDSDGEIRQCRKDSKGVDTYCEKTGSPFQFATSGVLHFSADYANITRGVEWFSA
jgi:hypothetical protein